MYPLTSMDDNALPEQGNTLFTLLTRIYIYYSPNLATFSISIQYRNSNLFKA